MAIGDFKYFGFQIDVGRQIERPEVIKHSIKGMGKLGYNVCQFNLEDAYYFEHHPAISRKYAYKKEFIQDVGRWCEDEGLELIPVIESLGHCDYITNKPGYAKYDEGTGTPLKYGCLSPSFDYTYELLTELYEDWCRYIPGQFIHAGLDETPAMGSYHQRKFGKTGFDRAVMFANHCNRLNKICKSFGRRMMMWGDMLYYMPKAIELLDKDIVIQDWYYYAFENTPKIEMFNFCDVDLSGDLKRAGFEVWGVPAIWPNWPVPQILDRWKHVNDWIRYGKERGVEGILLSDWENYIGFYGTADLMYRAFARALNNPGSVESHMSETLQELTGSEAVKSIMPDLLRLGDYHLTGHEKRRFLMREPLRRANENLKGACQANYESVKVMLPQLQELIRECKNPKGQQLICGLQVSKQLIEVAWELGAQLPEIYEQLCAAVNKSESGLNVAARLRELAEKVEIFLREYLSHWQNVRYPDDVIIVKNWAEKTITAYRHWADEIYTTDLSKNSLYTTPRLELTMHCHHPAMPVLQITALWPDGRKQTADEVMIGFESRYSVGNCKWKQYPSIALQYDELPQSLILNSNNYGQIGIENVYVMNRGNKICYKPVSTEGKYVKHQDGILWLGPVCASPDSPFLREENDIAVYKMDRER